MRTQIGDELYRFRLSKEGEPALRWVGLNPSTASEAKLDPTTRNIEKISSELGYPAWTLYNLYPLRCTDPRALPKRADRGLLQKNLELVCEELGKSEEPIVMAWGNGVHTRSYLETAAAEFLRWMQDRGLPVRCLHRNRSGSPTHPSPQGLIHVPRPFLLMQY
jgi:hypothetical protein